MQSTRVSLIGTLVAGAFWGLSGTAAQALFQTYNFPAIGLVTIRMLVAGFVLLVVVRPAIPVRKDLLQLFIIAVFGIALSQLGYLVAIQYSNAPTGTLLQFLFLPMVAGYEALTGALRWSLRWSLTLVLAAIGTVLLIGVFSSHGSFQILITPIGLGAGVLSAITAAYNSLSSRRIVREKGPWWLVTWGFIIGGVVSSPLGAYSISEYSMPQSSIAEITVVSLVAFVIIFGTILSFGLYLAGLEKLTATETGVAASLEPITAAMAAYVFLGVQLTIVQYIGGALILLAVILVASRPPSKEIAIART